MEWLSRVWIIREVLRPALDILILTFLIYRIYLMLVHTRAVQLVKGAIIIALIYGVAFFLKLDTMLWILNRLATVLVIIIAIVFQPELRNIFMRIGQIGWFRISPRQKEIQLDSVINAAEVLAGRKRGCLIVFVRQVGLKHVTETGTRLNADISSSLILSAFAFDTPLHDGAMIIQEGRISAASCFLPLSEQADIRKSFGSRHRAALGLAETTDAVVLVVSEEAGTMSLAYEGSLYYDLSSREIKKSLKKLLDLKEEADMEQALET